MTEALDHFEVVVHLRGNQTFLVGMISQFEAMLLNNSIKSMKEAFEAGDWLKLSQTAHLVKGASGYVGFGRLHYTCASLRLAYMSDQLHQLPNWYQMFIEKIIEAKRYIPQFLHRVKGQDVE